MNGVLTKLLPALCVVLWAGFSSGVQARSTALMRPVNEALAAAAEQTIGLHVQYFVGDGEAIVRAQIGFVPTALSVRAATARHGVVRVDAGQVEIDYADRPLTGTYVDTVHIEGQVLRRSGDMPLQLAIFSSAEGGIAHRSEVALRVEGGAQTTWRIKPEQLYQGETARIEMRVEHADDRGRSLRQVQWQWPQQIQPVRAGDSTADALAPGQSSVEEIEVTAQSDAVGVVEIGALASVGAMPAVALIPATLRVDPLPVAEVDGEIIEVGRQRALTFRWRNAGAHSIPIEALRLDINSAFADVALVRESAGVRIDVRDGQRVVVVEDLASIEPGQHVQVELRLTPQRPGPFSWRSFARPPGRSEFIPLAGDMTVDVAWPEGRGAAERSTLATDLELVSDSFVLALEEQMGQLPMEGELPIYLEADAKDDANWIVEDALAEILRKRGYQLMVRAPEPGENAGIIHYRLVSSRVVYSSAGGWPLLARNKKREAYGDLVLRLVEQRHGTVQWERRIRSYLEDSVPGASVDILGGEAVKRAVIEADNKVVERGLSASIIGGLVYIFFIL